MTYRYEYETDHHTWTGDDILVRAEAEIDEAAPRALAHVIKHGAARWNRERVLPELIRVTREEMDDTSPAGHERIIDSIERALRAEERREGGFCPFDLNRLIALKQARLGELELMMAAKCEPRKFISFIPEGV